MFIVAVKGITLCLGALMTVSNSSSTIYALPRQRNFQYLSRVDDNIFKNSFIRIIKMMGIIKCNFAKMEGVTGY
jgi:hypothetical protein